MAHWDVEVETAWLQTVVAEVGSIRGLEIPFWGTTSGRNDYEHALKHVPNDWDHVITTIPAAWMAVSSGNVDFGLASRNSNGREAAVREMGAVRDLVERVCERMGKPCVLAVQLASAPRVPGSRAGADSFALRESLCELRDWDWCGARLVVEHCDAAMDDRPPAKGFLPLSAEISAVQSAGGAEAGLGIVINWGRSAIEGRSSTTPELHVEMARSAGLLAGLMFSGTAEDSEEYGCWSDLHLPVSAVEETSIMDEASMEQCLSLAGPLLYTGIKVLVQPMSTAEVRARLRANQATLDAVLRAAARARSGRGAVDVS